MAIKMLVVYFLHFPERIEYFYIINHRVKYAIYGYSSQFLISHIGLNVHQSSVFSHEEKTLFRTTLKHDP